jgi:DNA-binding transcriptional ArsR family regulator
LNFQTNGDTFLALACPVRREIIWAASQEKSLTMDSMVAMTKLRQPTVTRHLQILERGGYIDVHRLGRRKLWSLKKGKATRAALKLIQEACSDS